MFVHEVMQAMENLAPKTFAETWDNCGLIIGNESAPVSRILLTLDVTSDALQLAERLGSEMIIAHHPLIFQPLKNLRNEPPIHHIVTTCVKRDLAIFAAHTNLDACLGGINDALAATLQLDVVDTLVPLPKEEQELAQHNLKTNLALKNYLNLSEYPKFRDLPVGFGRIATSQERIHAKPFVRRINNNLQSTGCIVNFDKDKIYSRILLWGGSFDSSCISTCLTKQIDCVVAGEIKHHDMLALAELDIHAIVAGHDATERPVMGPLMSYLQKAVPDCRVAIHTGLSYNNLIY